MAILFLIIYSIILLLADLVKRGTKTNFKPHQDERMTQNNDRKEFFTEDDIIFYDIIDDD